MWLDGKETMSKLPFVKKLLKRRRLAIDGERLSKTTDLLFC